MKKLIMISVLCICAQLAVFSQKKSDPYKMMYYQRYQSAIDIFKSNVQSNPLDSVSNYWLGVAYIKKELNDSALQHFKKLVQIAPKTLYKAGLAQAFAANKKSNEAQNILALLVKPEEVRSELVATAIGNAYAQNANLARAETYFLQGANLQPNNIDNYLLLGSNALKKGDGNAVYKYLSKAIKLDSNYAPTLFAFAKLYLNQKNPTLYLPYLSKVLALDSMYTPAWYEMYRYAYYNDKANVKKYYAKYLELSDKTEQQEYQLLVLDYNAKKYQNVIEKAKVILKKNESNVPVEIYKYLAFSYYKANNLIDAYRYMIQYMDVQDSSKITSFDNYLTAQFAVRLQYKDDAALKIIEHAFNTDTSSTNKKYYAGAMVNHYITVKDKYHTTVWREKLLPYKGINKVDMYKIGVTWFELDSLQRADSLFAQFVYLYPEEYKGIYMQAGIHAKLDSNMTTAVAAGYFESFIEKVAGNTSAE